MNGNELKEKLDELKTEDYIWLLYIGIIIISWYSNNVERKYFITGDLKSKEKYQRLMVLIFTILLVVYFYFTKSSYDDILKLKQSDSKSKKDLTYLSFLGSFLVLISGIIFFRIRLACQPPAFVSELCILNHVPLVLVLP